MNTLEADFLLKKNNIDPLIYSIGTPKLVECYVIEKENNDWITYYWERGIKNFIKKFSNEAEAVDEFIDRVVGIASLNEHRTIVLK